MAFHIEIDIDSDAENYQYELARILMIVSNTVAKDGNREGTVRNVNGNTCARYWTDNPS